MRQQHVWALLCLLAGSTASPALAQIGAAPAAEATVTYDVALHEFRCWREGPLTVEARNAAGACEGSTGWHPVTGRLYFVRGELVSVLLLNATAEDLFALDLKAEDLAEPTVPILGSLPSLPKVLPLSPPPTVVPGNATTFSATKPSVDPGQLLRMLPTADAKDFKAWVTSTLIDPLDAKEVAAFLAVDVDAAIAQLPFDRFMKDASAIQKTLDGIAQPATTRELVVQAQRLGAVVDQESALRLRLGASGAVQSGKVVADALEALRSPALRDALAIDSDAFDALTSQFDVAFPLEWRYARIDAIVLAGKPPHESFGVDKTYSDAGGNLDPLKQLLARLSATAPHPITADTVKKLKANLATLAELWSDVEKAAARADLLSKASATLDAAQAPLAALQQALNTLAEGTIRAAADLNARARSIPLDADLQLLPVGQWFSSKTVTVTLKQGQRVPLFAVGGVSDSVRASVSGDDVPDAKAARAPAVDLSEVRELTFAVYNLYRFQLGLGFVRSSARDDEFQVDTVTSGSGSTATTQKFLDQSVARDHTLLTTVNLIVYPTARHAFPWRPRYDSEPKPAWYEDLGAMVGFSVTSPNKDFIVGGAWLPRSSAVGLQVGWHIALRDYPPDGFDVTKPFPDTTRILALKRTRVNGLAVGLVFTTDFFGNVFTSIFKP